MSAAPIDALELASAIERCAGIDASSYVAERIGALTRSGDAAAAERLRIVADRLGKRRSA